MKKYRKIAKEAKKKIYRHKLFLPKATQNVYQIACSKNVVGS